MKRILLILSIIATGTYFVNAQADFTFNETLPLELSSDEAFVSIPLEKASSTTNTSTASLSEAEKKNFALANMRRAATPMMFYSADQVKLKLWSVSEAEATVKIHASNGKLVKIVEDYQINSGNNEMIIPVKELSAGAYWISFFKNGELISSRSYNKL